MLSTEIALNFIKLYFTCDKKAELTHSQNLEEDSVVSSLAHALDKQMLNNQDQVIMTS